MKQFVLGVGAHKGGTSWLHSYLSEFDQVDFAFKKELHVWDARFMASSSGYRVQRQRLRKLRKDDWLRFGMQNSDRFYEAFFRRKLRGPITITGDITPAYCGLSQDQLRHIRECILRMGALPRVVFLMRDPFERCWSAVRYNKRRGKLDQSLDDGASLMRNHQSPAFQMRTRYERICPNILGAFPKEEVFFGFYETLFEQATLERLGDFLNIDVKSSASNTRVNASPKSQTVSPEIIAAVKDFYADTYTYCRETFPETRGLWG